MDRAKRAANGLVRPRPPAADSPVHPRHVHFVAASGVSRRADPSMTAA
jgi:hypothetical protein